MSPLLLSFLAVAAIALIPLLLSDTARAFARYVMPLAALALFAPGLAHASGIALSAHTGALGGIGAMLALLGGALAFGITVAPTGASAAPTPGAQTSEFALTKYVTIIGTVLTVLGSLLATVQSVLPASSQTSVYVGMAIAVIGALMKIAVVLGYQSSRADVKVAAAEQAGAQAAAQTLATAKMSPEAAAKALE